MRTLRYDDPDAAVFLKSIRHYADRLKNSDTTFFLVVDDAWVRAIVSIHTEPYYFYSPAGSNLGNVVILNQDLMYLDAVLESAGRLVQSEGLAYLVYSSSLVPNELSQTLVKHEFGKVDHAYSMYVDIDDPPEAPQGLVFKPMNISERQDLLELQTAYYEGTGDHATQIIQGNLLTLSEEDLDSMFNEDTTFIAMENGVIVGIVIISVERGLLMSIAVSSEHRGKGIARKMLAFALIRLKELGWGRVYLRVHIDNTPAIKLYESFGFVIESERESYVYYPTCQLLE